MQKKVMIVVNTPVGHASLMRQAIGEAGGGRLGKYSYCSFSAKGTGRFLPDDDAQPAVGTSGEIEAVEEERIEVSCSEHDAPAIVRAIRAAHPYEEPAIFAYPLLDLG